jgi:hypothetical protein
MVPENLFRDTQEKRMAVMMQQVSDKLDNHIDRMDEKLEVLVEAVSTVDERSKKNSEFIRAIKYVTVTTLALLVLYSFGLSETLKMFLK